jgi:hypothetical protein
VSENQLIVAALKKLKGVRSLILNAYCNVKCHWKVSQRWARGETVEEHGKSNDENHLRSSLSRLKSLPS